MAVVAAEIVAKLRADVSEFSSAMNEAVGSTQKMSESTGTLSKVGGAMFLALGAAAVGFVGEAVNAAIQYDSAHVRMVQAIKNVGESFNQQQPAIQAVDDKMRGLGFREDETETALSRLIPATHSTKDAINLMGVAADVAAGRHLGLEQVTQLLVRAETGHATVLSRLGVTMHDAAGQTLNASQAIQQLADQYRGQASAQAETFGGKIKVVEANLDSFAVTVGHAVIPIIEDLSGVLADTANFFAQNTTAAIALGVAVAAVTLPPLIAFTAEKIGNGIQLISDGFQFVADSATNMGDSIVQTATNFSNFIQGGQSAVDVSKKLENGFVGLRSATQDASAAETGAGEAMTAAEGAGGSLAATLGILVAGSAVVLGAFVGLGAVLGVFDDKTTAATKAGQAQADVAIKLALANNDAIGAYNEVNQRIKDNEASFNQNNKAMDQQVAKWQALNEETGHSAAEMAKANKSFNEVSDAQDRTTGYTQRLKDELAKLKPEMEKEKAQLDLNKESLQKATEALGLHIDKTALDNKTLKEFTPALADLQHRLNTFAVDVASGAGVTAQGFIDVEKQVQAFSKTIASSLEGTTNPFTQFSKNFNVGIGDFNKFINDSTAQAQTWADKFNRLMSEGINQGWIQEIAKAGPAAIPLLDNLQQDIDVWGVGAVNDVKDKLTNINNELSNAYAQQALFTATKTAEAAGAVKAYLADLKDGGTKNLTDFANNGDDQMKRFAYAELVALAQARADTADKTSSMGHDMLNNLKKPTDDAKKSVDDLRVSINQIPPDKGMHIHVDGAEEAAGALRGLHAQVIDLTSHEWAIAVKVGGDPIPGFTGANQGSGSDRNSKKNIVPVPW